MPDDASKTPAPFDVRTVKELVALMSRHDLSEIDLRDGEHRIRLRRGPRGAVTVAAPVAGNAVPAPVSAPAPAAPAPAKPPPLGDKPAKQLHEIKSPTPGTFYSAPNPNEEPYVRAGSRVSPNTVVCLIEAMKLFNEIQAECSGVIAEVLVENQQPVEYGQVLFRVDTSS